MFNGFLATPRFLLIRYYSSASHITHTQTYYKMSTISPYDVALPKAVEEGHKVVVEALLKHNAGLIKQRRRVVVLCCIFPLYGDKEIVDVLLRHKANTDTSCNGYSPLLVSFLTGRKDISELLLKAKANVNQASGKDRTSCFTEACREKDVDSINCYFDIKRT